MSKKGIRTFWTFKDFSFYGMCVWKYPVGVPLMYRQTCLKCSTDAHAATTTDSEWRRVHARRARVREKEEGEGKGEREWGREKERALMLMSPSMLGFFAP